MGEVLRCTEIMPGCGAVVRADTAEEILKQAAEHAKAVHGMTNIDARTVELLKSKIRDA